MTPKTCNAFLPGTATKLDDGTFDITTAKTCGRAATVRGTISGGKGSGSGKRLDLGPLCSECFDRIRQQRRPKRTFEWPLNTKFYEDENNSE